ncbi:MAG: outer membrane beta-barrel protein [Salinibacter sp.]
MTSALLRNTCTLLLAVVVTAGIAGPAQAQFGVAGGLNFESAGDIETSNNSNGRFENATGYHIGVVYELGLGPATLRPGFFYRRVGTFQFEDVPQDFQSDDQSFDVAAWQIPVDLRFTVLPTPLVSPYVLAGPMVTLPRGDDTFEDATEEVSYSLNVGVGANISLPVTSLKLQPELRYEFGATKFIKDDFEAGGVEFNPQDAPRFSAFGLRLNVLF